MIWRGRDSHAGPESWEVYNACQQAAWEDNLEGVYAPGARLSGDQLRRAGFDEEICRDVEKGYSWRFDKLP